MELGEEVAELGRLALRNLSFGGGRGSRSSYDPGFGGETRWKLACRIVGPTRETGSMDICLSLWKLCSFLSKGSGCSTPMKLESG